MAGIGDERPWPLWKLTVILRTAHRGAERDESLKGGSQCRYRSDPNGEVVAVEQGFRCCDGPVTNDEQRGCRPCGAGLIQDLLPQMGR